MPIRNYTRIYRDMRRLAACLPLTVALCATVLLACGDSATPPSEPAPTQIPAAPTATLTPPTPTASPIPTATPEPTHTPIPTAAPPTPTPVPTATPAPTQTPVRALQNPSELTDEAFGILEALTAEYSPRESATDEELAAALHLEARLDALGYETSIWEFDVAQTVSSVELIEPSGGATGGTSQALRSLPINLSVEGVVAGVISDAGFAFEDDIPESGLEGRVALIERGTITFEEKVNRVADAGAIGAIVFNNQQGLFRGAFRTQSSIPAVGIGQEDGLALRQLVERGEAAATVSVVANEAPSRNVIAELPGTDADGGVVILGAHYDTVPNSQGASDNGSGVSTLLTIASHAAEREYPFTIRVILFGAEEIGLFGSRRYAEEMSRQQVNETIAMLNFDALGSGSGFDIGGDDALVEETIAIGEAIGMDEIRVLPSESWLTGASDHGPFQIVGIPVLVIFSDDLSRINSPADTMAHIDPDLLGYAAAIGLGLLDSLAE